MVDNSPMPFTESAPTRLYYEDVGEGEPILCVMGLAADHLAWALQVPAWSKHHRMISFDNRDVGQSQYADGPYEISDMAADTVALADELELDTFHLVGVSMGGAISQELALGWPERLRTLTLCVTWAGSGAYARAKTSFWAAQAARMSREEHVENLIQLTMSEAFYENVEGLEYLRKMMLENPHPQTPEAFARQLDAISRHETRDRLGEINVPTHVIGAEHDILVPVWKSHELAELIPGARHTVIEGAPHGLQLERMEEFNSTVLEFLAGVEV